MHFSRLAGFIIDCRHAPPDRAAQFWSHALAMPNIGAQGERYARLDASNRDITVEVQNVDHDSRVHLDIESDDVEAEVTRLEKLGAKRVHQVRTWWVMEAPTGQRFCVIRASTDLSNATGATRWEP